MTHIRERTTSWVTQASSGGQHLSPAPLLSKPAGTAPQGGCGALNESSERLSGAVATSGTLAVKNGGRLPSLPPAPTSCTQREAQVLILVTVAADMISTQLLSSRAFGSCLLQRTHRQSSPRLQACCSRKAWGAADACRPLAVKVRLVPTAWLGSSGEVHWAAQPPGGPTCCKYQYLDGAGTPDQLGQG